ncbi:uncharacterized protein LOC144663414 [Oculina patagonica]
MESKPSKRNVTVRFENTVRQVDETLKELQNKGKSEEDVENEIDNYDSEDGWDTDLETPSKDAQKTRKSADITGKSAYLRTCRRLGVPPVTAITDTIHTSEIALAHHGLGPQGGRALAKALVKSTTVEKLDLQENSLGEEGVDCFAKMLLENCYIKWVNLAGNMMSSNGARAIGSVIAQNKYLQWLDLSFNNFVDKDAKPLAEGLMSNTSIKCFSLSQNSFCEAGGETIGPVLAENNSITELNLSWNHLRLKGAIAICKGMRSNSSIEILDLSWNGFADEGAEAMGEALKKNDTLLELDLSHNRITEKGAQGLAKGLQVNQTLRVLKIGFNPLGNTGAYALMKAINENADSALEELHLDNVTVKKNFASLLEEFMKKKPAFQITSGASTYNNSKRGSLASFHGNDDNDPGRRMKHELLTALKNFLLEKRLRAVDLFNCLDKDKTQSVSPEEMFTGLKKFNVPLTDLQLRRLIRILDKDGDGEIDYGEFAAVNEI